MSNNKWTFTSHDLVTVKVAIDLEDSVYYVVISKTKKGTKDTEFRVSQASDSFAGMESFVIGNLFRLLMDGRLSEDGHEFLIRSLAESISREEFEK